MVLGAPMGWGGASDKCGCRSSEVPEFISPHALVPSPLLERKELDGLLSNTRAPYKPPYLSKYYIKGCIKVFPLREESSTSPSSS